MNVVRRAIRCYALHRRHPSPWKDARRHAWFGTPEEKKEEAKLHVYEQTPMRLLHLLACKLLFVAHLYHGSRLLQCFLLLDGTFYTTGVVRFMQVVPFGNVAQPRKLNRHYCIHVTTLDNSAFNMINVNGYGHLALREQQLSFYIGSSVVVTGGSPKLSCPNR